MQPYEKRMEEAHRNWRNMRFLNPEEGFHGLRFMLLHSFSHALMSQFSIECGYNAASLRERIYSHSSTDDGGPMAGVLIYTSPSDSAGTFGGLVSLGSPQTLVRQIEQALENMQLCASDPLCSEHDPLQAQSGLHWAACHACLFSPETSCERGNKYLDRTILVPTLKTSDLAFFV